MSDYKRLTKHKGAPLHTDMEVTDGDEIYERLAELEDKIENGTLVELPKKCYQVIYVLGWEILEYDIVKIRYDHTEGIISVDATRPFTIEYFTKDDRYKGRVLGTDVFFTKPEAEAKLRELKENSNA